MRFIRNAKGFTLIELMVVILIIGILVAIAIPVFNSSRDAAYKRTCQANLRTLDGAGQTYRADTGGFPSAVGDLVPTYLKVVPKCQKKLTTGADPSPYQFGGVSGVDSETAVCPSWYNAATNPHTYP